MCKSSTSAESKRTRHLPLLNAGAVRKELGVSSGTSLLGEMIAEDATRVLCHDVDTLSDSDVKVLMELLFLNTPPQMTTT